MMDRRDRAQLYAAKLKDTYGRGFEGKREEYRGYIFYISSDGSIDVYEGVQHIAMLDNRKEAKEYVDNRVDRGIR